MNLSNSRVFYIDQSERRRILVYGVGRSHALSSDSKTSGRTLRCTTSIYNWTVNLYTFMSLRVVKYIECT